MERNPAVRLPRRTYRDLIQLHDLPVDFPPVMSVDFGMEELR
jgi:hypothetical protein